MVIKRDLYLNKLIRRRHNGLVKIITGMRRTGKSYLLFNLFHDYLVANSVEESHIIEIALDDRENKLLRNPDNLLNFIKTKIIDAKNYYVLLDEIQMTEQFEDVLNSLLHIKNVDVYVTGSNSKFLSKDIITEFRGRSDEVRVYPLSFLEFLSVFKGTVQEAWNTYYTYGGLPLILSYDTHEEKSNYLVNQFKKVYISDIVERNNIRNTEELEELINILSSNIGSLTNPKKLTDTFKSVKGVSISPITIKSYLDYLEESFLIDKSMRFDVKGKKYISTPSKYYFSDLGLRNGRLNFRQQEENHIMENIIYNELKIRGFNVDVGVVEVREKTQEQSLRKQLEIDFIATSGNKKYYIQSAFDIRSKEKRFQEKRSLINVSDSFKKIIIVRDDIMIQRDDDGIVTMSIFDFLLKENSLDY
ncbi:MAG: ATP-binding protein [Firmicutes bacterium]|nr:ATP-binding protein [Bacillota bacterium]